MPKKPFLDTQCPIARSVERVGEWWSILILRDAFHGLKRFDQFQKSLGIAPNMLARRLKSLVEGGLLAPHRYSEHPPREEYRLTARGRGFRTVLLALLAWGNKEFAHDGIAVQLVNTRTGVPADPWLVDRVTGVPITEDQFTLVAGPAADERMLGRMAFMAREKEAGRGGCVQAGFRRASKSRRTRGDKSSSAA